MVALVEYSKGTYKVKINLGWSTQKVLLKSGVKLQSNKLDPITPSSHGTIKATAWPWYTNMKAKPASWSMT